MGLFDPRVDYKKNKILKHENNINIFKMQPNFFTGINAMVLGASFADTYPNKYKLEELEELT